MPQYILELAAQHSVNGAIWIMKANEFQNSQYGEAMEKIQEILKNPFLAAYGTFGDEVKNPTSVTSGLYYQVFENGDDPSTGRVHLCAPGLFVSASHALEKTKPFLKMEYTWEDRELERQENPPNMPDLSVYLKDQFCNTVSNPYAEGSTPDFHRL
jgi:hypothetical protein